MELKQNQELGLYKIIEMVGSGGMGTVYKAHDKKLARDVAIKVIHSKTTGDKTVERFIREAQAIAKCNHPGIVQIYHYDEIDGYPYFVMEYVEGMSLQNILQKPGNYQKNLKPRSLNWWMPGILSLHKTRQGFHIISGKLSRIHLKIALILKKLAR